MTVRQAIEASGLNPPLIVEFRLALPEEFRSEVGQQDAYRGVCVWNGNDLQPADDDFYSLNEKVVASHICGGDEKYLVVITEGKWEIINC